jgi:hypothetical protein
MTIPGIIETNFYPLMPMGLGHGNLFIFDKKMTREMDLAGTWPINNRCTISRSMREHRKRRILSPQGSVEGAGDLILIKSTECPRLVRCKEKLSIVIS